MKVYLDACCLNRPFDEQNQERIRLESEAIIAILNHCLRGEWQWIGSEILEIEIENTPDIEKRRYVWELLQHIHETVLIQAKETDRAKELENLGFKPFDAMHIACAESGKADIFLSTDDRLLKLASRIQSKLNIIVVNPLKWISEVLQ